MGKKRLGKGLASLIEKEEGGSSDGSGSERGTDGGPVEIELARIELNPEQPRKDMDEERLSGLAESIRNAGVLQPIVVREKGDMYELVMGERRLRAAHRAELDTIPAYVREVNDDRMLELALIENVQREDLNAMEKADALHRMLEELDLTQEQVGEKLGLNRSTVANFVRLLELPEEIREMVSRETLSAGHARALLSIEDPDRQLAIARKAVKNGLNVRQTEELAARQARPARTQQKRSEPSPQVQRLQRELQECLGTRVEIKSRGDKGKILIHFSDNDQFERLYSLMTDTTSAGESAA
ncbi:MAG: ParB/RepB/Spo0J family partition protein [Planctomycetota bacterium]